MRNLYYSIYIIAAFMFMSSCGSTGSLEKHFGTELAINAECVEVEQILQMCNIALLDDYIVLQNGSEAVDDFFFVYSRQSMEFLYSFARRGRGPEEYLLPVMIKNIPGNVLGFRDHATDKVSFYEIGPSSAVLQNSFMFKSNDRERFFWEINYIESSSFLLKHQGYKNGHTELWNIYEKQLEAILPNTFEKVSRKLGKNYYTIFDDYLISACGKNFARAYFMIDRIELGIVNEGKIQLTATIGSSFVPDFHLYRKHETTEFNIDKNIIYYENIYAGKNAVYALYSGERLDNTEQNHSSEVEVYDWEGQPVSLLKLAIPVSCIAVDESERMIYALNPELAENKILKYRY